MSTNSNVPNNSEEVDLGQLFKLIGNVFDRFFNFIASIFKNIFLAVVWTIFLFKKHIKTLGLATFAGLIIGAFSQKTATPRYKSSVTVVQNYPIGDNLYSSVGYYNDLLRQQDYETLGTVLDLDLEKTKSILGFDVQPVVSENNNLLAYNNYIQELDSVAGPTIGYKEFLINNQDHTHKYQQIKIESSERNSFKAVFENIVKSINLNPFFVSEQRKDILELTQTKTALEKALHQSNLLQETYKKVLEDGIDSDQAKPSEIGITIEGSNRAVKTREFDLFISDLEIRAQLVEIERELLDKQHIVEMISNKQDSGFANTTKTFFGIELSTTVYSTALAFILTSIILFSIEFLKFIEKYKTSV